MMGAVFAEMDKEWVGRRWFNDDSIGRAVEGAVAEHVALPHRERYVACSC